MTAFRTLKYSKYAIIILLFAFASCTRSPKEIKEESAKYFTQAVDYYQRGYYSNAKDLFIEVLNNEIELKLSDHTGECYLYLGLIEYNNADYETALEYNKKAVDYFNQRFNRRSQGIALNNIGNIYSQLGHYKKAVAEYIKSLNTSQFSADKEGEAIAQINIGSVYGEKGDYQSAFNYFSKGFEAYEIISDLQGQAVASNKIGEAYLHFGSLSDALNTFEFSRQTAENAGLAEFIPSIMNNIALTYFQMGDYNSALNALTFADEKIRKEDDPSTAWSIKNNLGDCFQKLFQYDTAIKNYNSAIEISDEAGELLNSAFIKLKIAGVKLLAADKNNGKAISGIGDKFAELADYFDGLNYIPGKLNALAGEAITLSIADKSEDALELMNEIKDLLNTNSLKISNRLTEYYCISPDISSAINFNVPFLISKKYETLLDFNAALDRRKVLNFLNDLNEFKLGDDAKNKTADSLKELNAEIRFLKFEIANEKGKTGQFKNDDKLDNLTARFDEFNSPDKNAFEDFISSAYKITTTDVKNIRGRLNDKQLLLYFFSSRDNITVAGLTKGALFTSELSVNEESLKGQVTSLIKNIEKNDTQNTFALLKGIYNRLILPVQKKLNNFDEIIFAPYFEDASLQYLPFQALIDNSGKYFCESKKIVYSGGFYQTGKAAGSGASMVIGQTSLKFASEVVSPSKTVKKYLLKTNPGEIFLFTPVYFSMGQPTSSYIELDADTTNIPEHNILFGEIAELAADKYVINNFFTDKKSSLKLFPFFIPASKQIVISHYNIPEEYKYKSAPVMIGFWDDIYQNLDKKNLYWISYFNYLKL
ncbi:MAG: tetratricopeptide repeat protein [Ignavibacteriaceae bacterium]|nr:tetratricopeptide repeat protein [Ignavibacteriaceae bacterium]